MFSVALALAAAFSATGPSATGAGTGVFMCRIGGKVANVTASHGKLTYTFGPRGKPEISITGDPAKDTVFYLYDAHNDFSVSQLRFVRGAFSYVVFDYRARTDEVEPSFSGVAVMKGTKTLAILKCDRPTTLNGPDFDVPYDDEAYVQP